MVPEGRVRVASEKTVGGYRLMVSLTWAAFNLQTRPKDNQAGLGGVAGRHAFEAKSTSCRMTCLRYRTDTRGRRSYGAFRFPFEFRYSCS